MEVKSLRDVRNGTVVQVSVQGIKGRFQYLGIQKSSTNSGQDVAVLKPGAVSPPIKRLIEVPIDQEVCIALEARP